LLLFIYSFELISIYAILPISGSVAAAFITLAANAKCTKHQEALCIAAGVINTTTARPKIMKIL
jgi:hypothetical protein